MKVIRQGVSRQDLMSILMRSERPEESLHGAEYIEHIDQCPEFDPEAIGLFIDGRPMAAGGLRRAGPTLGVLWLVSCVDLEPYRFPLMRHAHQLVRRAKAQGWKVVSVVPTDVARAKNPSEHLGLTPHQIPGRDRALYV